MPYAYSTIAQTIADLSTRLYDQTNLKWSVPELQLYVTEALREWNALTSFWRAEFAFPTTQGNWWYDLTQQTGSLRPYTVTDAVLISQIEYGILEPQTTFPLAWLGSKQFGITDIQAAISSKRNQLLGATGCTLTRSLVPALAGRTYLTDLTIDIRRVAWLPTSSVYVPTVLHPADIWDKQSFDPNWTSSAPGVPGTWLQNAEPPLSFDVDRTPPSPGQYEVLSVQAGQALNANTPTLLGVPDDWTWVIRWGALARLLGEESNAKDAFRAMYAQSRWEQGIQLLQGASAVIGARVNNLPLGVDAVRNGDDFNIGWQAVAQGSPQTLYTAGLNLVATNPAPSAGPFQVTASVVQNAPIPASLGSFIQISREDHSPFLDECQHIAMFKQGGAEFEATFPLHQNFMTQASRYNAKLKEMGDFTNSMYELSHLEQERNPVGRAKNE